MFACIFIILGFKPVQGGVPIRFHEGLPIRYKLRPFGVANKVQTFFKFWHLGLLIRYKLFFRICFSHFDILPANKVQVLINHSLYPVKSVPHIPFRTVDESNLSLYPENNAAPLSQRQNSLNEYFLRIDFAETLQSGSLDENNQTYQLSFSEFVLLPV